MNSMMATVGTDGMCKIWDISKMNGNMLEPQMVHEKDLKQGELFSVQFYSDIPWVLAAGGSRGEVAIWDTEEADTIKKNFSKSLGSDAKKLLKDAEKITNPVNEQDDEEDGSDGFEDMSEDESSEELPKKKSKRSKH